jgi:hypothetical protein
LRLSSYPAERCRVRSADGHPPAAPSVRTLEPAGFAQVMPRAPPGGSVQADTMVADTAADCLHPTGRWQRAPDDPRRTARCCSWQCAAPSRPPIRAAWRRQMRGNLPQAFLHALMLEASSRLAGP